MSIFSTRTGPTLTKTSAPSSQVCKGDERPSVVVRMCVRASRSERTRVVSVGIRLCLSRELPLDKETAVEERTVPEQRPTLHCLGHLGMGMKARCLDMIACPM